MNKNMFNALYDELLYQKRKDSEYEKILGEATKDALTGLYNKKMFLKLLTIYKTEAKMKNKKNFLIKLLSGKMSDLF